MFLVGILPALVTLWIRRAVPETEEWHAAKLAHADDEPSVWDLFRGDVRRTTVLTILVCSLGADGPLGVHVLELQHLRNLPDVAAWTDGRAQRNSSARPSR